MQKLTLISIWVYTNKNVELNIKYLHILIKHGKMSKLGVPVVVQWLINPTRNHEV